MIKTVLYIFGGILLIGLFAPAYAEEVTNPVVDGMVLQLGNYVQRVQVRAKSLGPGVCGVKFELKGDSTNFLAPPLTWSRWTDVGPAFIGPSSQKLHFSVECDTDTIAQVKYSK